MFLHSEVPSCKPTTTKIEQYGLTQVQKEVLEPKNHVFDILKFWQLASMLTEKVLEPKLTNMGQSAHIQKVVFGSDESRFFILKVLTAFW